MGPDEGEWIHGDGDGAAADEDEDEEWPGRDWPTGPVPAADRERRGDRGIPGFSVRVAAVVAVLAAAAGVAAALLLIRGTPTAAVGEAVPSASASAGTGALPALPGPPGSPGRLQIMLTGRVLAVSGHSITIGGNGPSVTAAITGSTTITGNAGGIKVGDEVSAQITGTGSKLTVTAIQDPAAQ
jgi:hypothetical protein